MICKNCKAKIPEESKYCEKCGLKIERDEIQVPHEIIESTASRKNNNKTNFLLVILVFKNNNTNNCYNCFNLQR